MSNTRTDHKADAANTSTTTDEQPPRPKYLGFITLPACLEGPKSTKCWKIFKYVYVIGIIAFGFSLVFLKAIDSIDDYLDEQQRIVLEFLIEDHVMYIILCLVCITLMKSIGMKDVLGLRTISVIVLAKRIVPDSPVGTLFMTMFIIGILSSVSKLVEYQVIGHELQVVQGTPFIFPFKWFRQALLFCPCVKDEKSVEWFDPKYTFAISEKSRDDKTMHIMANLEGFGNRIQLYCKCGCCPGIPLTVGPAAEPVRTHTAEDNASEESIHNGSRTCTDTSNWRHYLCRVVYFVFAVMWTSLIEWVQPITELFLFAHNWDLSFLNVVIIVFSEFCDFDKAWEAMWIIDEVYNGGDIIAAKVTVLLSKPAFWSLGWFVVMPPTLMWSYIYCDTKGIMVDPVSSSEDEDIEKEAKQMTATHGSRRTFDI
eukprot:236751_1